MRWFLDFTRRACIIRLTRAVNKLLLKGSRRTDHPDAEQRGKGFSGSDG